MEILLLNVVWMSWNLILGGAGVFFAWLFVYAKKPWQLWLSGLSWLLFIPNASYMFTDVIHLIEQWPRVDGWLRLVLLFQYLGLFSLTIAFHVRGVELFWGKVRFLSRSHSFSGARFLRRHPLLTLGALHGLIAFGVVMGREMRTNSWYVLTQPTRVIADGLQVLLSPSLLWLTLWLTGIIFLMYLYFTVGWRRVLADMSGEARGLCVLYFRHES